MSAKENTIDQIETHPLPPFLPPRAALLMLGTFPPPHSRWAMEFFYPNFQNDMWRIFGLVFFGDRGHFVAPGGRNFDREKLVAFLTGKGIALGDTARQVVRAKGNASDKFLEITEIVDLPAILEAVPLCRAIVTTGDKATRTLLSITGAPEPKMGGYVEFAFAGRGLRHYRMPSSSRAYPMKLEKKAEAYEKMFRECGLL